MPTPAKKSLGQHWLTSVPARDSIVAAANLKPEDKVLEIGPGRGFLTEALLATGAKVVAVEADARLISELEHKFANQLASSQLTLLHQDILDFNPDTQFAAGEWKLAANIPYYLTGLILKKFIGGANQPKQAVLLLQKEVVDRILAREGKETLMSLGIKAYGTPRKVAVVKAGSFAPPPQVDSAILLVENISRANFKDTPEKFFWHTVHQGLARRRKMLKTNLGCSTDVLAACKIEPKARGEDLTLADWLCLCTKLPSH
jgi:16S rRNA (adenine1518-N6/adenine1519-N6)-dimethyltransferase